MFAWATNLLVDKQKKLKPSFIVSRTYLWETIGLSIGGLIFNFFLITSIFPFPRSLNNQSLKFRYPNLVESVNSLYGNIIVTQKQGQYNFYEGGQLVGSSQETEKSEYLAHLILSQHQEPKKILIVGGGLDGLINEILKYPFIKKVDYLEIDPQLVTTTRKYLPVYLNKALEDPRVKINLVDGRKFL
ncbi:unnamed protein product, partial [marine sediment metagenome]